MVKRVTSPFKSFCNVAKQVARFFFFFWPVLRQLYEDCTALSERCLDRELHPSHDALRLAGWGQGRCYIKSAQITGAPNVNFFLKYLFGRRFEIQNFRNICCKISCLPAFPRIFQHLKNGIITHFQRIFIVKRTPRIFGSLFSG